MRRGCPSHPPRADPSSYLKGGTLSHAQNQESCRGQSGQRELQCDALEDKAQAWEGGRGSQKLRHVLQCYKEGVQSVVIENCVGKSHLDWLELECIHASHTVPLGGFYAPLRGCPSQKAVFAHKLGLRALIRCH